MSTLEAIARAGAPLTYTMNSFLALRSEIWAMEIGAFRDFVSALGTFYARDRQEIKAEAREALAAAQASASLVVENGVAHIPIKGVILRNVPWFLRAMDIPATGIDEAQAAVGAALAREDVEEIRQNVDSPGGSVSGLAEWAATVFNAREHKPVHTHVNGVMASAALWPGVQASRVSASPGSLIGALGAFMTITDSSEAAGALGVKVHMIRSGPFKGTGTPGVEVSDDELAHAQHLVDEIGNQFGEAVALGRGLPKSRVKKIANGKLFTAEEAQKLKLIDTIELSQTTTKTATAPEITDGATNEGEDMTTPKAGVDPGIADRLAQMEARLTKQEDENSELRQVADSEKARGDALAAQVQATNEKSKDDLIQAAVEAERIPPAALEAVEAYAKTVDAQGLEAFLAASFVAPVTRKRKSGSPAQDVIPTRKATVEDEGAASILGMDVDELIGIGAAHEEKPAVLDFRKLKASKNALGVTVVTHGGEVN